MNEQEQDFENEIQRIQSNLIFQQYYFKEEGKIIKTSTNELKDENVLISDDFKLENDKYQERVNRLRRMAQKLNLQTSMIKRFYEQDITSQQLIDENNKQITDSNIEKKKLEFLLVNLSQKMDELRNERFPIEKRRQYLQELIEMAYIELQRDFKFRKYLQFEETQNLLQEKVLLKQLESKTLFFKAIQEKLRIFQKEFKNLMENNEVNAWQKKFILMVDCMNKAQKCESYEEMLKIKTDFIKAADLIDQNKRPYKLRGEEIELQMKLERMTKDEQAFFRMHQEKKMDEIHMKYKAVFQRLEKQINKLKGDNIKLIEEHNLLFNEQKRLKDTRKMIRESIKQIMGANLKPEMINSEEDEAQFQQKKMLKRIKMKRSKSTQNGVSIKEQIQNQGSESQRERSSGQTARDFNQNKNEILPKTQINTGFKTQRDNPGQEIPTRKILAGGFIVNSSYNPNQQKQRKNTQLKIIQVKIPQQQNNPKKYLDKVTEEQTHLRRVSIYEQTGEIKEESQCEEESNKGDKISSQPQQPSIMNYSQTTQRVIPIINLLNLRSGKSVEKKESSNTVQGSDSTRLPKSTERVGMVAKVNIGFQSARRLPLLKIQEKKS